MIRIAEANAKMHLREFVHEDDVNMAIRWRLSILGTIANKGVDPYMCYSVEAESVLKINK
jgi:DNA replicative helicase MCM subunit Mcm2 (Cdc46/Mcm family)